MSKLAEILRTGVATPANPAKVAGPERQISRNSDISRGAESNTHFDLMPSTPDAVKPIPGDFRAALVLGRLHVCCNCRYFDFAVEPSALGSCRRFDVGAWPFVPFWCTGFAPSHTPAAPAFFPDPDGTKARAKEYTK